jgi:hypothetical protein
VQEGGDVKSDPCRTTPVTLPFGLEPPESALTLMRAGRTAGPDDTDADGATKREPLELAGDTHPLDRQSSKVRPPTGEPDAGDPHVRFGGRGDRSQSVLPTPIKGAPAQASSPIKVAMRLVAFRPEPVMTSTVVSSWRIAPSASNVFSPAATWADVGST